MAPVIWGLDLGEITWSKFGNKNMWNNKYHLRRSKIIFYQLAMIFAVVSESLGTAALADYIDQQNFIQGLNNSALEYNNDYVGAGSYNVFTGVFLAFVFGAAFFFDLIWPERHEDRGIRWAWKLCAIAAAVFEVASAFALTVITATRSAYVSGVDSVEATRLLRMSPKQAPLEYKRNGRAVAAVVFIWPAAIFTVISAVLLWKSHMHDDKFGDPFSTHYRNEVKAGRNSVDREAQFIRHSNVGRSSRDVEMAPTATAGAAGAAGGTQHGPDATPSTVAVADESNEKLSYDAPRIPGPAYAREQPVQPANVF